MKDYTIKLHAPEQHLPEISGMLEARLKQEELCSQVEVHQFPISYIDYGVNPAADADLRPYFKVKSKEGKELRQTSDILIKFIRGEEDWEINEVIRLIQASKPHSS